MFAAKLGTMEDTNAESEGECKMRRDVTDPQANLQYDSLNALEFHDGG